MVRHLFLLLVLPGFLSFSKADTPTKFSVVTESVSYSNPVIRGEVADPSVIRIGSRYFAAGTSSEWAPHYPVFSSDDLINWKQEGHIFNTKPAWTSNSFWAPELFYHNGKVYCYYTARRASDGISYIGVATADSPTGKFNDHGIIIEYGREAIDAFVFDDNGQLYISWKAYGLDQRPIELLASRLSSDGLKLEGEPFSLLKDDERIGMEGQSHYKIGDFYYIIYAAKSCCGFESDYEVRVARSKQFAGPYEKYSGNPILYGGKEAIISVGHGSMVTRPDGRIFYLCHAYINGPDRFCGRQPVLYEMTVDDKGWLVFSDGAQAGIGTKGLSPRKDPLPFTDSFTSKKPANEWTWNFPYSDVVVKQQKGNLSLSGTPVKEHRNGAALCLRPTSPDYSYETQVQAGTASFGGLTLYGDDAHFIAWGVENNRLVLKSIRNNKETELSAIPFNARKVSLKIAVKDGCMLSFYFMNKSGKWQQLPSAYSLDAGFLNRWDRVARPGLLHIGNTTSPSVFSYFTLQPTVNRIK